MSRTTSPAPEHSQPPSVSMRPSDRLAAQAPRHAAGVILIAPRPDAIVIRIGQGDDLDEGAERLRREVEALVFSSELL